MIWGLRVRQRVWGTEEDERERNGRKQEKGWATYKAKRYTIRRIGIC